jgi:hypothetical protein
MDTSQNSQANYAWQRLGESERVGVILDQAPPDFTWGCRVSEDFVLATASVTLWFASPHELVSWFAIGDPDLGHRFDDESRSLIRLELQSLADAVRAADVDSAKLRTALQGLLAGWTRVEWIGTFDELCSAATDDARQARQEFNSSIDREPSDDPIPTSERAAFATFLDERWRGV